MVVLACILQSEYVCTFAVCVCVCQYGPQRPDSPPWSRNRQVSYGDSVWPASLQLAAGSGTRQAQWNAGPVTRRRRLRLPSGFPDITHCAPPDGRGFGFTRRDVPTARCAQPGSVDCKLAYGYRHVSMRRRRADSWEMHFGCGSRRPEAATLRSASMNRLACIATNLGHTSDLHAAH
jgi:hypothetical protein